MKFETVGKGGFLKLSWNVILLFSIVVFVVTTGFSCGQGNTPDGALVGAQGFSVGLGFGPDSRFDSELPGDVHDLCQYFTAGIYKVKKMTVEVFVREGSGQVEKNIYPPVKMKDGVNFVNGNPRSPIGDGIKFKIPENGAFWVRVRIWGYDCEDLNPLPAEGCPDCCDGEDEGPYWEEVSPKQDNQQNRYAWAYITYPKFIGCS